jgi:drug/metabolite transporter (DMT)-like permease
MAISAISFGTMPIFARIAYAAGANPVTVLFLRFTIAGIVMLVITKAQRISLPRGRTLLSLIFMGSVLYVGQSLTYFTALTMASAGLVSLLLYLYPAILTLLLAIFDRSQLSARNVKAIAIALLGTALTVELGGGSNVLGVMLAVCSAFIYAVYILIGDRIMQEVGAYASTTVIIISAALVYSGIAAVTGVALPTTELGWAAIFANAIITAVVAILSFFAGLERIGPINAATISALAPVVTVILAALVLGDTFTPIQLLGGTLILGAVTVLVRKET